MLQRKVCKWDTFETLKKYITKLSALRLCRFQFLCVVHELLFVLFFSFF